MKRLAFTVLIFISINSASAKEWDVSYCIPVKSINFNPFREITDGKDLAYLMLLRSYISTDANELGILEKYEFSPDGKIFLGRLSQDLKWSDGIPVSSFEAAIGIAKTLGFRALGKRVKVEGAEQIDSQGWEEKSYSGIEIVDAKTFRLKFVSEIDNLTGVMREALSTNSRHNRFWPIKLDKKRRLGKEEVIAKFPSRYADDGLVIEPQGAKVLLADLSRCSKASEMTIFPEFIDTNTRKYLTRMSPNPSAITFQPNTKRLGRMERKKLIGWIRKAFSDQPVSSGIVSVKSFFLMGESGFNKEMVWQVGGGSKLKKKYKIGYEIPAFKTVLEKAAELEKIDINLVSLPTDATDLDGQLLASGMIEGRHLILQDVLSWKNVTYFLSEDQKTTASLRKIGQLSASTIPPDLQTLKDFEKKAYDSQSFAPIARKYPIAYSDTNILSCLDWTQRGELTFSPKKICEK